MRIIIPFKIIKISDESYHLIMKMSINGKAAKVVLDTGASHSAFDIKKTKKFNIVKPTKRVSSTSGLGTNTMDSHHTIFKKIRIGELEIINYHAVLLDLSHVNQSYASINLPEVDGVLGSDILVEYNAIIDYEKKVLKLKIKKPKK